MHGTWPHHAPLSLSLDDSPASSTRASAARLLALVDLRKIDPFGRVAELDALAEVGGFALGFSGRLTGSETITSFNTVAEATVILTPTLRARAGGGGLPLLLSAKSNKVL